MRLRRLYGYSNLVIAGVLLLVAWALLTLLASRPALKHLFDLTPQARATVDVATKQLLAQVREQDLKLEFHLFFRPLYSPPQNEQDRAWWEIDRSLQTLTRDLLRQYAYLGGDAVKIRDYDPDRQIQQTREQKERFQIPSGDSVDWIVIVLGGRHKKLSLRLDLGDLELPNIAPTPGIAPKLVPTLRDYRGEEALTSAIKSLMLSGTPIVYFLTGYGEASIDNTLRDGYSALHSALQQAGFQVRELALRQQQDVIPADAAALAILEPKNEFSEREADLLMAYLRRGGRLFIDYAWFAVEDLNSDGGPLGRRLGFALSRDLVFQKQPASNGALLDGNPEVMELHCLYNPQHPITGPLDAARRTLSLGAGREFRQRGDMPKGVRLDTIVRTGPNAWLARSQMGPTGVPTFDYRAPSLPSALAQRDVGIVADVDGDQKDVTGHAVLLAGLAFNNDRWRESADLAMNIFNWMAERKVLVPVASDRYHARQVKINLEQVGNIEWLLIAAVPGLFLVLGLLVSWRRSRSR